MGEFCYRLKLILWKNYLLRRRHKKRTIIEILWPLALFLILMWVRTRGLTENINNCHTIPKALPSVGGFEFIQNVICSITNPCFDYHVEDIDHWNKSLINLYVPVFERILEKLPWQDFSQYFEMLLILDATSEGGTAQDTGNIPSIGPEFLKGLTELSDTMATIPGSLNSSGIQGEKVNPSMYFASLFCGNVSGSSSNATGARNLSSGTDSLLDGATTHFTPDPDATPECNKIFEMFTETAVYDLIWRVFKLYVRGGIYFAPDNSFTRAIMEKVEAKIKELKGIEDNTTKFLQILRRLQIWEEANRDKMMRVQFLLRDSKKLGFILQTMGLSDKKEREKILILLRRLSDSLGPENNLPKILNETISSVKDVERFLKVLPPCIKYDKIKGFATEKQATAAAMPLITGNRIWAVVIFHIDVNVTSSPNNLQYKIRMDSDKVDRTYRIRDPSTRKKLPRRRPLYDLKYITYGFAYLEEMIERAVTEIRTGISVDVVMVYLQQYPFPCYIFDEFIRSIAGSFPLLMILSWLYSAAMMIKYIVYEKENHLKEMMKIVGLSNFTHWLGWFVDSFIVLFTSSTILTLILKFGKILTYSDFTLIWFFLLSYTISVISFSFMFSTFFNIANSAAAAGGIMFFMTYMPYSFTKSWLEYEYIQWYHVIPVCLFSNVAFGFGCNYFAQLEYDGVGAQWTSLGDINDRAIFELRHSLMMLWCDSFLYLLIALYVEAVSPGSGIPKPWCFMCLPSTYFGRKGGTSLTGETDEVAGDIPFVEPAPAGLPIGVKVRGLSKTYSNGNVALKNLNMDFYENQITSFLGHNGAGKTTTISILIGLFPPTKGTAIINGCDITKDIDGSRRNVGICPQYNIFFDRLTVSEHIIFFSALKGKHLRVTEKELDTILNDLGIPEKRKEFPKNLSGGMKRKLCVAIAFSGDSKTIFLDEPTSGVDPFSRRSIWELLLKYKKGRTIILTTHFMDEADILGDRIAIISRGTLKTCGSSLYLKSHFGKGYSLHLVRQQKRLSQPEKQKNSTSEYPKNSLHSLESPEVEGRQETNIEVITTFVNSIIPEAALASNIGTEVTFVLPYSTTSSFPKLFNGLDESMHTLGVLSYGISDTSLEDVFLHVIVEDLQHSDSATKQSKNICNCFGCCQRRNKEQSKRPVPVAVSKLISKTSPIAAENQVEAGDLNMDSADSGKKTVTSENEILRKEELDVPKDKGEMNSKDNKQHLSLKATKSNVNNSVPAHGNLLTSKVSVDPRVAVTTGSKPVNSRTLLYLLQLRAIILKRFINSRRSLKSVFFEIVLPAIFVAAALIFTTILPDIRQSKPLEITPYKYPTPLEVFFSDQNQNNNQTNNISSNSVIPIGTPYFSRIVAQLTGPIGFSTECLSHKVKAGVSHCNPKEFSNKSVQNFHLKRAGFKNVKMGHCSCSSGTQTCGNVEKRHPPKLKTHAKSVILDASKLTLPEWLLKTFFKYFDKRVGGYQLQVHEPYPVNLTRFLGWIDYATSALNDTSSVAPNFTLDKPANAIKIWFNNKAFISPIAYLNAYHNVMLRDLLGVSGNEGAYQSGFSLYQHPLDFTPFQRYQDAYTDVLIGLFLAICMINALSYVPASFVVYLIQERASGGKHLHLVSGVKPFVYWLSNFIYDMTKFLVPVVISLILFAIFNVQAFISQYAIWAFTALLILYGWSVIPLMYPASHVFAVPSTAFVVLACGNIFIGVITTISEFVLHQLPYADLMEIAWYLRKVYVIFPQYCLGRGMINLVILQTESQILHGLSIKFTEPNRFDWDNLGKFLFCLFLQGCVFSSFNLAVQYRTWIYMKIVRPKPRFYPDNFDGEDEDVHEERQLVMANSNDPSSVLVAQRLTKFYRKKQLPAVNGITFAIRRGECFGLLGINGAGKTSTFKMLTGDVLPSGGKAMISGFNVVLDRDFARKHLGYCPQEDGLDLLLNAKETIQLYGSLRGLKSKDKKRATQELIQSLGLGRYALRKCGNYSGGNKRKLSTAIALIGDPDIIFLDEPTSGMDPGARRQLWKVILHLASIEKSVVLTTHSMEECEALCSRVGIMVNGKFKCLGSIQHLKNRFGSGYVLTVRCMEDKQESFYVLMQEKMTFAKLVSSHCSQIKFSIAMGEAKLSYMFELMQSAKQSELIEEYSVSQTTLDDIFVKFAKPQEEE